jgi:hypothetical protein
MEGRLLIRGVCWLRRRKADKGLGSTEGWGVVCRGGVMEFFSENFLGLVSKNSSH